ncbi:MAG: ATP synthase F1 subunit gamma [Thermoguttaceae bacterium]|nr:ATP synthase F1 subunit gamma [Thermoguttaceae bacterium]
MAKARALDKRRKSIKNIRKITRTMELVSTAQFRRAMERAVDAESYTKRIARLVADLANADLKVEHPLLARRESTKKAVLLIVTANRGLCGGYNAGVLRAGTARLEELLNSYDEVELFVSGKRGVSHLNYRGVKITRSFTQFDHKTSYDDVLVLADECLTRYKLGEIDRFDVAYSRFVSLSKQIPASETLLPLAAMTEDADCQSDGPKSELEYEFLPSPESILEEVVPNAFRIKLFKCFLDAAVSEQIARMMAMKAATDNADSMISSLTTTYNRARQSQITNEIIEVISGATALQ